MPPELLSSINQLKNSNSNASVAHSIIAAIDDPDQGATDISRIVSTDPLLSANIMRIANSNYYGLRGKVASLPFAISILGMTTIRSIALTSILRQSISIPHNIWKRFLENGAISARTAEVLSIDRSSGLSSGLLADFGEILIHNYDTPGYLNIKQEISGLPVNERGPIQEALEVERYSVNHSNLSRMILEKWGFPESICHAVSRQHEEPKDSDNTINHALYWGLIIAEGYDSTQGKLEDLTFLPSGISQINLEQLGTDTEEFVKQLSTI
ncbi:MAG: HDOD domain-containing protein [Actinomycetota bacterium]|nr:HDOD domain-containing protein [Actinomycetota bacterium]